MKKKIAIIDLGSNSVRLNIYVIFDDGSYRVIDEAKESVRLSENMGDEKILRAPAIERTISALKMYSRLIKVHNVTSIINFATAAVRSAQNGEAFLEKVKLETGLEFKIISGDEESYYGYYGVINTIDIDNCIILDTGGGSSEFTLVKDKKFVEKVSLPLGAVVLSEKFLGGKKNSDEQFKKIYDYIDKCLAPYKWLSEGEGYPVIGLGGTIRTLARIDRDAKGITFDKVSQYKLDNPVVYDIFNSLKTKTVEQRKSVKGLGKDRADIILGGCFPLLYIFDKLKSPYVIVSNTGIRDGVFFDYYFQNEGNVYKDLTSIQKSIINTLLNFDINLVHSKNVAKLSMAMFNQLKNLHNLDSEYTRTLYAAAMLHDIGTYVNFDNHNKHSMYLILNANIHGLTVKELVMAAIIAYFHEDELSRIHKFDYSPYSSILSDDDIKTIEMLSCFVNLAEMLDRNESSYVKDIKCFVTNECVEVMVIKDDSIECILSKDLIDLGNFKRIMGKELVIV